MPIVTVIMAAYNASTTIEGAIMSIVHQTLVDWELIVVDDASADSTADIVRSFSNDKRIRLFLSDHNRGAGVARNLAIAQARGEYIAILDADDYALPSRLAEQLACFAQDSKLDVVGSQLAEFGKWGGPELSNWPLEHSVIRSRFDRGKMGLAHCSAMMKTSSVANSSGYDEYSRRAEDFAMFRRMPGAKFMTLPSVLTLYRTDRPVPLSYVIASGRHGRLARVRTRHRNPSKRTTPPSFPSSLFVDLRSLLTFWRRRWLDRKSL